MVLLVLILKMPVCAVYICFLSLSFFANKLYFHRDLSRGKVSIIDLDVCNRAEMNKKVALLLLMLPFLVAITQGGSLDLDGKDDLKNVPPRIIRTCCSFGSDIGVVGVPFYTLTETVDIEDLGEHHYLGGRNEHNGILYTCRGGFVDVGHLRDQADWTAYLHRLIISNLGKSVTLKMKYEGGKKNLTIDVPYTINNEDALRLAGRITYDLSVWHEVSTWYGVSSVPFVPERYSSFSIEDNYSNLLGITLGMRALKSDKPYEEAMTVILRETLDSLGAVATEDETLEAMEMVHNVWWTREKRYPKSGILIERDVFSYYAEETYPMLIPQFDDVDDVYVLKLPRYTTTNKPLTDYYKLELKLNSKFPCEEIFEGEDKRTINQNDFAAMIDYAANEISQMKELNVSSPQKIKRAQKKNKNKTYSYSVR